MNVVIVDLSSLTGVKEQTDLLQQAKALSLEFAGTLTKSAKA